MNVMPKKQGLYDPWFEHDACGVGVVANIKGKKSNKILREALVVLRNMDHRGGQGADENSGDGAGILLQIPHNFFAKEMLKQNIRPEFLNRIDETVMFNQLGKEHISSIVRIQLERVQKRLDDRKIKLQFAKRLGSRLNAVNRIKSMEEKFDRALEAVASLDVALENFKASIPEVEELAAYYESDLWRRDFEADSAGKLPCDLKRGILSEDGIYNLLTDYQRLKVLLQTPD